MADLTTDDPIFLTDPVAAAYEPIAAKVKALTWRQFEDLVAALLLEAGFVDVQRLTSGSQQGKDIVAIWPSRFYLGSTTRFRIQVKHKPEREFLTKSEVGDSIADFLSQHSDEVLLIVTNGKLANDLLEQVDRLLEQGHAIHCLAGNRFLRFLSSLGRAAKGLVGIEDAEREALHHTFEIRDWVEQLCTPSGHASLFTASGLSLTRGSSTKTRKGRFNGSGRRWVASSAFHASIQIRRLRW